MILPALCSRSIKKSSIVATKFKIIEKAAQTLAVLLLLQMPGGEMPVLALPGNGSDSLKMERRSLTHGGLDRTYTLYIPHSYDGTQAMPLLFLLHGGGSDGRRMINFTGFDKIASESGLIVVCPDGVSHNWNDGRENTGHKAEKDQVDDVGYIRHLLDDLSKELKIDNTRIYASGISNGAMMSFRLGLELSDRLAAIGTVVGLLPEPFAQRNWTGRPMPAVIINGTADPLVPYNGGEVHFYRKTLGRVISAPATLAFWVKHNQCNSEAQVSELPLNSHKSGLTVKKTSYTHCCDGADVEFYSVEGGGHTWPRDSLFCQYLPVAVIGKACRDIDSTELIWNFFKKHSLQGNTSARQVSN